MNNTPIEITEKNESSEDIKKILHAIISNWYWFLIGLIITFALAYIYLKYTAPQYKVTSTILIKDNKGSGSEQDILGDLGILTGSKNVDNEVQVLQSHSLMEKVVKDLNLTTSYYNISHFSKREYYKNAPIEVADSQLTNEAYKQDIIIQLLGKRNFIFEDNDGKAQYNFGEPIVKPYGKFVVRSTFYIDSIDINDNDKIQVNFSSLPGAAEAYLNAVKVDVSDKESSVINLNITTPVPQKGIDILNALTRNYNETAIEDKNKTAAQTMNFIDERLRLVASDLSSAEDTIERFKQRNQITDITAEGQLYLTNANDVDKNISNQQIQLSVLHTIEDYMQRKSNDLVPSSLGINDPTFQQLIDQYNQMQLKKEELLKTTPATNPVVQNLNSQIESLRQSILENAHNLENALQIAQQTLQEQNSQLESKLTSMPSKEKQLVEITRQKNIKENLYVFLLQKKEDSLVISSRYF